MVKKSTGENKFEYHDDNDKKNKYEVDFTPPFRRVR